MNRVKTLACLAGIALLSQLFCCTRNEGITPAKSAPQPASPVLINVVHGAVKSYVSGDKSFQIPQGITIDAKRLIVTEMGKQVEYVEITGLEQKKESLAVIAFRFPSSWLASEKENFAGLESEKRDLMACAEKIQARQANNSNPAGGANDSCRILGITANGKKGIAIVDDKVKHIEMLTYSLH